MTVAESGQRTFDAPSLVGQAWLNGDPYQIRRSEGDTVLLDFWSSTCVTCLRGFPRLALWSAAYQEAGLVTIGIHTPDYDFAADAEHVKLLVEAYGIGYPVVLDNDGRLFAAYGLRMHPARVLVDRNGIVRSVQYGESEVAEFERTMQALLRESGYRASLPTILSLLDEPSRGPQEHVVDLPCGYRRGSVGNVEGFVAESTQLFKDPMITLSGRIYLDGVWRNDRAAFRSAESPSDRSGMRIVFNGEDLFAVLGTSKGSSSEVSLLLDEKPVSAAVAGPDVDKRSTTTVEQPRLYHLLRNLPSGEHTLTLTCSAAPVDVYQVSFVRPALGGMYSRN